MGKNSIISASCAGNDQASRSTIFSVRNLKKNFANVSADFSDALSGIDLDIFEGECLVIAGANGSGKTVFMRILAGLLEPSEGEVLFRGKTLWDSRKLLRGAIGLVFQDADTQILGETVEEDIRFGPENLKLSEEEIKNRLEENLNNLDLSPKRDYNARNLSGGEKRRLAVAGVLAMGCETIIMDEPFANLDWHGVVQVLNSIKELKRSGKTVIILTHELEKILAFADRLVILVKGKIRDYGECDEVLNRLESAWGVRDPRKSYRNASDCTWLEGAQN